jgi:hypothetical protein
MLIVSPLEATLIQDCISAAVQFEAQVQFGLAPEQAAPAIDGMKKFKIIRIVIILILCSSFGKAS